MTNEVKKYQYDAIVVLGGSLYKRGEKFYPSDYRHSDQFGMLGAGMRIVAAVEMYLTDQSNNFVFSTGITEKNKQKFGNDVPTEASVYANKFLRVLEKIKQRRDFKDRFAGKVPPEILLEDSSFNTLSNIQEVLKIIKKQGWNNFAILSSRLHIPRIKLLYQMLLQSENTLGWNADFISAEDLIIQLLPGKYDQVIKKYHQSPEAKKRLFFEQQGIESIKNNKYAIKEFQLLQDP